MDKFRNRGQGTLTAILTLVGFFLVVDLVIAAILIFDIPLPGIDKTPPVVITDNTIITDNVR